ncbi:MAG: M28 family peptidase, partial [Eudoraea sp.]|nr:M28 family peptidase [Eudoraea sp.]
MNSIYTLVFFLITTQLAAQTDTRLYQIISAVSADRIASDISTLANFGTRHTLNDPKDFTSDSPCAMDNAIGMAGTLKAARVPSKYQFYNSIIYVGLSGEEQGLFGGKGLAAYDKVKGWDIIGILNNDMISNITGVD